MSNLGWYQILTTAAKKVGGPLKLVGIIFGGGALAGGGLTIGGIKIKDGISEQLEKKRKEEAAAVIYEIQKAASSKEGLSFEEGTQFKVLEKDGDAGLIEIIGDENNPYFVSLKFLALISNYKMEDGHGNNL
jgi:hypothetical protein